MGRMHAIFNVNLLIEKKLRGKNQSILPNPNLILNILEWYIYMYLPKYLDKYFHEYWDYYIVYFFF